MGVVNVTIDESYIYKEGEDKVEALLQDWKRIIDGVQVSLLEGQILY